MPTPCAGRLLAALSLLLLPLPLAAEDGGDPSEFEVRVANVREVEDIYRLDAVARLELTPAVREALHNGVDITISWEIEIDRRNKWWLDADIAFVAQRYRLSYHQLSRVYIVTNLNTDQRRSYRRLRPALDEVGNLVGFPLIDRVLLDGDETYLGYVRVRLEHDELPLPLRAVALFTGSWDLASDWREWSFE